MDADRPASQFPVMDQEQGVPSVTGESDIRYYWLVIGRKKTLLAFATILVAGLAAFWSWLKPDMFESAAKVELVDPGMSSKAVAGGGSVATLARARERMLTTPFLEGVFQALDDPGRWKLPIVRKNLDILHPTDQTSSPVLKISYRDTDGTLAQTFVQKLASTFVDSDLAETKRSLNARRTMIASQVTDAKKELAEKEAEIAAFQTRHEKIQLNEEITELVRLRKEYEAKTLSLESQIRAAEMNLRDLQTRLTAEERQVVTAVRQGDDPRRMELARLQVELTNASAQYTPQHPIIQDLRDRIEQIKKQIDDATADGSTYETKTYAPNPTRTVYQQQIISLEAELQRLRQERATVATSLAKYESDLHRLLPAQSEYNDLQRQLDRLESKLRDRQNDRDRIELESVGVQSAYRMLEDASNPLKAPRNLARNTLLGLLTGLLLGLVVVVTQESLDVTVRTPADIRRYLGLPTLGIVPRFDRGERTVLQPDEPKTAKAEVFRLLRTNVHYAFPGGRRKILMIASSMQSEGKTTIAVNLGVAAALEGQRVVLVSADLRQPAADNRLREAGLISDEETTGLAEYLDGTVGLKDVVRKTKVPGLFHLAAGRKVPNPSRLLSSERLPQLLAKLDEVFDFVLVDVPATLPIVDSTLMADKVDGVLLVVSCNETSRDMAAQTLERLYHVRSKVIGALLNKVPADGSGSPYYHYFGYAYGYKYY